MAGNSTGVRREAALQVGWRALFPGGPMRLRSLVILASLSALPAGAQSPPEVTAIKAARLFDGKSDRTVAGAVVIVEGSTIKAVGIGLAVPPGAKVLDLGDATLLPGFIDAHVHLTFASSDNWYRDTVENLRRDVPERTLRAAENARQTLMAGFTTVRNVGATD